MYSLTEAEQSAGVIEPAKLEQIAADITSKGFAVVPGLVSKESCELLMESVLEDANLIRAVDEATPHEKATGKGHLQLGLRRRAPYVRPDLLTNPMIESIVATVLKEGAWLGFYNGNVNLPGSVHQPLHFDRPFSWKTREEAEADGEQWPPRGTTLSCSVALTDITLDNGATEIYPGSHRETAVVGWPRGERLRDHPELLDRWGPPARMEIPAGGICFRDPRMWHRGVPNPSDATRPMIALTYHSVLARHWRGVLLHDMNAEDVTRCKKDLTLRVMDDGELGDGRLVFDANTEEVFQSHPSQWGINRNVRFAHKSQRVDHTRDAHMVGGARVIDETATA